MREKRRKERRMRRLGVIFSDLSYLAAASESAPAMNLP